MNENYKKTSNKNKKQFNSVINNQIIVKTIVKNNSSIKLLSLSDNKKLFTMQINNYINYKLITNLRSYNILIVVINYVFP